MKGYASSSVLHFSWLFDVDNWVGKYLCAEPSATCNSYISLSFDLKRDYSADTSCDVDDRECGVPKNTPVTAPFRLAKCSTLLALFLGAPVD